MTPEERAKQAYNWLMEGGARTFEGCVAQAIRQAIEAERESCALIADSASHGDFPYKTIRRELEVAEFIASRIRARSK